jgi:hypothetical protein
MKKFDRNSQILRKYAFRVQDDESKRATLIKNPITDQRVIKKKKKILANYFCLAIKMTRM